MYEHSYGLHEFANELASMHFLSLAHGNGTAFDMCLLGKVFDLIGGVTAHGQQANEWRSRVALFKRRFEVKDHRLRETNALRLGDVFAGLGHGPVGTPRSIR